VTVVLTSICGLSRNEPNTPVYPVAGKDYPRNFVEFPEWFKDDKSCAEYLARVRWPNGFVCPFCRHTKASLRKDGRYCCGHCGHIVSVTSKTALAWCRKSLRIWFLAAWYITEDKRGGSALLLQQHLGFANEQTAWEWMHKLRRAMVRPGRDMLHGAVEIDDTYVGGAETGVVGRQTVTTANVVIAAERRPARAAGRIRMGRVPNLQFETLAAFVQTIIAPGSVIYADGADGYEKLGDLLDANGNPLYTVCTTNIKASGVKAHKVESVGKTSPR
jgi:hypothetical protein